MKLEENIKKEIQKRMMLMGINSKFIKSALNGDVPIFERQSAIFSDTHYSLNLNKTEEPYTSLAVKIEELKIRYKLYTYMVQLTHTSFGDLYSLFFVSENDEDWEYEKQDLINHLAFVYVYNATDEMCSEFGSIEFKKGNMGGIVRVA